MEIVTCGIPFANTMKSSLFLVFALVGTAVAFSWDGLFQSAQETANSALKNLATKAEELKLNVTAAIEAGSERHQAAVEALKTKIEESLGNANASDVIETIVNAINAAEEQIETAALSLTEEIAAATEAAVAETTDAETTDAETTDAETTVAETTVTETTDAETTDAETTVTETTVAETTESEA